MAFDWPLQFQTGIDPTLPDLRDLPPVIHAQVRLSGARIGPLRHFAVFVFARKPALNMGIPGWDPFSLVWVEESHAPG